VALSDALEQLAARARAIEQNARESEAKGRADLEARAGEARKTADQHTEQLRARSAQSSDEAERSWNDVQRSWKEHVARIRKRIDDRKAELDLERAKRQAEWAEDDAMDAIDFATSALDEAEYAVLDAELAQIKVDELAASLSADRGPRGAVAICRVSVQSTMRLRSAKYQRRSILANVSM